MRIAVFGASGHARVIIDMLRQTDQHHVAGLVDSGHQRGARVHGVEVLGTDEDVPHLAERYGLDGYLVAVGDNWRRKRIVQEVGDRAPELSPVKVVDRSAAIGRNVEIGGGSVVMAGAVINAGTRIGDHCIVNTSSSVDHECVLGDFASVAPGATLGGNVRMGGCSAVCLGANVVHEVEIGRHSVIGAGAVVVEDVPQNVVAYGVPARIVRERSSEEQYL